MKYKPLLNVIKREFKRMLTSSDLVLICLAAPVFYGLLFSFLYINKRASDINIAIVNMDNSAMSRKLVRDFDATPELKVNKMYTSPHEAYMGIFHNNLGAFYFIPKNFSADLKKGKSVSAFNAANSSTFLISSTVLKKFTQTTTSFSQKPFTKLLVDKGYSYKAAKAAFAPVVTDNRYIFNTQMNYSDFLLPCLLLAVMQQILLVAVGTTMSSEKKGGTYGELSNISEGSFVTIFIGKSVPYILLGTAINLVNMFIMLPVDLIFLHSFAAFFLMSTFFVIAVVFFGMLISALFTSPEMSMAVLMFYSLPTVLLSGFAWPSHALPFILKAAALLFPSTYAINPIRLSILGDMHIKYAVLPSFSLIIFAAVCFAFSCMIEKKTCGVSSGRKEKALY